MKKILLILMMSIFLISLVSAFEFDNKVYYENNGLTARIENAFGLGDILGRAKLTSHSSVDEIKQVDVGNSVVMEYELTEGLSLGEVQFIDMKNGKEIKRDYHFEKITYEDYTSPRWKTDCSNIYANGSNYCTQIKVGENQRRRIVDREIYNKDYVDENMILSLVTDVQPGDYVDGIWTIGGKKIKEHAEWNASLDTNNVMYYDFDETSGTTAIESISKNNITNILNSVIVDSFLPGKMRNYTQGGGGSVENVPSSINGSNSRTFNFWLHLNETGNQYIFQYGVNENGKRFVVSCLSGVWTFQGKAADWVTGVACDNHLNMHTITYNETDLEWFINGTSIGTDTKSLDTGDSNISIGSRDTLTDGIIGSLDEFGVWSEELNQGQIDQLYNNGAGIVLIETASLTVTLNSPDDSIETINNSLLFTGSFTAEVTNLTNSTLNVWNSSNYLIYENTSIISGVSNSSSINYTNIPVGDNYLWNYYVCGENSSLDVICSYATNNRTFNISAYTYNDEYYNVTSFETATESFSLNITPSNAITVSSVTLNLNGTSYSATKSVSGNQEVWETSLTHAANILGNKTFNWSINYGSGIEQTEIKSQYVNYTIFDLCNSTNTIPYVNYTFKDEGTLSYINASITTSTFEYYLGDGSETKTLTFINTSDNPSYAFCLNAENRTLNVDPYIQYKQGSTYPQRIYNPTTLTYTNTTTNKLLYLLSSTDGIYTTFQVLDSSNRPLNGVDTNVVRTIDEESVTVGTGTTDSAGSVTFWVNPDFSHTFTFTKSGYGSLIYSIVPTQSSYTVNLGTNSSQYLSESDLDGLKWYIFPSIGIIENSSERNFGFNISASNSNLVKCRIDILNQNKSITLSTNQENAINSNSSCFVQTNYSSSLDYQIIKGRLLIDIGDGWVQLEDDANWIFEPTNTTGSTFTDFFNGLKVMDLEFFNDNPNHRDYTYILIFFLVTTIICAVMNHAGWDIQERGGMVFLMWIFVVIASIPGFLTFNDISNWDWFNQYYFAFVYSCFVIGYFTRRMT